MGKKDPEQIFKEGKQLTCPICNNNTFNSRKTQLNTKGASFLGVDWANKNAQNYICSNCGYIYWFLEI